MVKSHLPSLDHRVVERCRGSSLQLVYFRLVGPSLQPVEVGSPPATGCMVP
jgi:hypothetical protein